MVNILEPVVRVLRMMDGDMKSTMCYIYESICLMREAIKAATLRRIVAYIKIVDEKWMKMLLHPSLV